MSAPFFSRPADSPAKIAERQPAVPARRFNPWRMFVGSMIPNWLQCRTEIGQGAKLAYARLAQHAGKDGECFPKQKTLAAELGVSERTANEYVRVLVNFRLIEKERPGLGMSNRYFFLDHPWIYEGQPANQPKRQDLAVPNRKNSSAPEPQECSASFSKENQRKENQRKREQTHSLVSNGIPKSLEEAVEVARQLGIEEEFARHEFHAKKAVGWKDGYGNFITSWLDHLQARWPVEQRKRNERRAKGSASGKRSQPPPRRFDSGDYHQPVKDF